MRRFFNKRTLDDLLGLYNHENKTNITEQQLEDIIINQINTCCVLKSENETWQHYIERSVIECNIINGISADISFDDIKRAFVLYLLSLYYKTDLLYFTQNILVTQIMDLPYNSRTATMHRYVVLNKKAYNSVTSELYSILPKYNRPEVQKIL